MIPRQLRYFRIAPGAHFGLGGQNEAVLAARLEPEWHFLEIWSGAALVFGAIPKKMAALLKESAAIIIEYVISAFVFICDSCGSTKPSQKARIPVRAVFLVPGPDGSSARE